MQHLRDRIEELKKEKSQQKAEYKQIKQTQRRLAREKREKEEKVGNLKMKCDDLQRLKFGSLVNLEALETTDVNPQGVQLRAKLLDLEKQTAAKVKAEDEKIVQLQETYTQLIQSSVFHLFVVS